MVRKSHLIWTKLIFQLTRLSAKNLILGLFFTLLTTIPVKAAEKIFLVYGPLNLSLRVSSLEQFAKDGTINRNLDFYLRRITPEEQVIFREALLKRTNVSPILLSRFFNTEMGEDILTRLGRVITIQGGINGKYALRAALVQAAFDPDGLNLLNVIRQFPTNMQIQGELILQLSQTIDRFIEATRTYTKVMAELSAQEAETETPVNFAQLPDIRKLGEFGFQKEIINLNDKSRNREFYVIIYKPQKWLPGKTPVVIFSHGLASRPEDFEHLAQHLTSYGFVVALPQHPGSDTRQAKALINGFSREVFDLDEFINRPKDISFVIDELERRNQAEFEGRLDLEHVGVAGHSFGGYTALAVAGAEIDFDFLQRECDRPFAAINVSLLLQCRALSLPREVYNFRDKRVQAIIGANPVNSSIFGQKGIEKISIPVMFITGNYDLTTPAVFEQVGSFVWLKNAERYLVLVEGKTHIDLSQIDINVNELVKSAVNLTLPDPNLINLYRNSIILAFFQVYIAKNTEFNPYLSSSYAVYLSKNEPFAVHMISGASVDNLIKSIEEFKARVGPLYPVR